LAEGICSWKYDGISGTECISEIYYVSQKAIGKNSRSTPGTYTGIFEFIKIMMPA
jgi:excinuclease UvrABC ATPase subunit